MDNGGGRDTKAFLGTCASCLTFRMSSGNVYRVTGLLNTEEQTKAGRRPLNSLTRKSGPVPISTRG